MVLQAWVIKHLMTAPKGNSKFCFPETLNAIVCAGDMDKNIHAERE